MKITVPAFFEKKKEFFEKEKKEVLRGRVILTQRKQNT